MSTSFSSSDRVSPLVPYIPPAPIILGAVPANDGSLTIYDQETVIRNPLEAPREITPASLRMDISCGRVPLVQAQRNEAPRALMGIRPGSAMALLPNLGSNAMRIYYEGGIFTRKEGQTPTTKEWCEYARIAASRGKESYPTVAMTILTSCEGLTQIGHVDVRPGNRLTVHLYDAEQRGAREESEVEVWKGGWVPGAGHTQARPLVREIDGSLQGGIETSEGTPPELKSYADERRNHFEQAKADALKKLHAWRQQPR